MRHITKTLLTALMAAATAAPAMAQGDDPDSYSKFRVGGYGEMLASFKGYGTNRFNGSTSGNTYMHRNTIAIPRFVIAGDYRFNRHWNVGAEIEFEAGGTGTAWEIENTENGEWETEVEKGGEVALEQFHITYTLDRRFNVRAGHMVLPVGLTNAHHEPILFYGTSRPEGETVIIPSTWHETGLSIFGQVGSGYARFNYAAYVTAGLNANGFDRNNWAAGAKQGLFEVDNFTSPAYTARVEYDGVPGLRLGGTFSICNNVGANSDKPDQYTQYGRIPVRIVTVDAQYLHRYFAFRGNLMWGTLDKADKVSQRNNRLGSSPYSSLTPVAKKAVSFGAEAGLNVRRFFNFRFPDIVPFVRYDYYNPQYTVPDGYTADKRLEVGMWTAGLNYKPLPYLVVKADYTTRRIGQGQYHRENEFAVGVAFTGWFWKK